MVLGFHGVPPGPRQRSELSRFATAFGEQACGVVTEYPPNHFRLDRNDVAIACRRCDIVRRAPHLVAEAEAASGLPELHATAQSASCLVGQVLQEERVHCALQPDVQMRHVPLGERDNVHAGEGETLEEACRVFLVPAESIQRLREHDVESLVQRISHERLEAGPKQRGTGDRVIRELLNDRPTLARSELPAHPELVRNGRVALVVR
jgi:hypothetical protein